VLACDTYSTAEAVKILNQIAGLKVASKDDFSKAEKIAQFVEV
jgi:hypothetical protein